MSVEIHLTKNELQRSAQVGYARLLACIEHGTEHKHGSERLDLAALWFMNVIGAQGELAAAKALNIYWPGTINAKKHMPDLRPNWEIRTLAEHHYDLVVRDDDIDDHRFLLLTGNHPFQVHGWILGRDAKSHPEWFKDRGQRGAPAFWVPQGHLQPAPYEQPCPF